ncbi:MAG: serine/threonine-protein kinase, partial [Polyangiales bacterium]
MTAEGVTRRVTAADDPLVGVVVGRYQLLYKLASGGMGTVYVGRATGVGGFERLVAVKVLHAHLAEKDEFVKMFLDEARLAARIHHPNVVATLDVFEEGGRYFLVMDYVRGLELGVLIRRAQGRQSRLPVPLVLRIVLDAAQGLGEAHALTTRDGEPLNLVHRDVSPQNILVGADGISRLTDFGVAKAEHRLSWTRGGGFKGKLAYASPEQLDSSLTEQRSDLFSLGIVLWEALTHRRLFTGEDKFTIMRSVLEARIPAPSSINAELAPFDPVVAGALAREPSARFGTAAELIHAIENAAAACGIATQPSVAEWVRALGSEEAEHEQRLRSAEASIAQAATSAPDGSDPSQPQSGVESSGGGRRSATVQLEAQDEGASAFAGSTAAATPAARQGEA